MNQHTLTAFIEDNHRLISVFGIFIAVSSFASQLPLKGIGILLSLLFLIGSVLIWLEMWQRFPTGSSTWRLSWFENTLSFITLSIVAYFLLQFRVYLKPLLILLIWSIILNIISDIVKQTNLFNRLFNAKPGEKAVLRYLFGIIVIVISIIPTAIVSGLVLVYVLPPLTNFLDSLNTAIQSTMFK